MIRFALIVVVLFVFLAVVRLARPLLRAWLSRSAPRPREGDLVRDPVCGTWIDRRMALRGRSGGAVVPVCSEKCRRLLESA